MRFSAGEQKKVLAILTQMQKELRLKLMGDLTDFGKARVNALLKQCNEIIAQGYNAIQGELDFTALADHVATTTAGQFTKIGLEATLPTVAAMKSLVNGSIFGAPSSAWWSRQSDDLQFKFGNAVRQGVAQGESMQDIIRRVFGSKRLGTQGIGFPAETLRRNASALVHSSVMQIAADARMAVFQANADILKGVRFLATLDSHTSLRCIALSGAEWDLSGNPIKGNFPFQSPPLHFNCRSVLTAITKSYAELGRPDIPEVPKGTRASDEGQIPADTTFTSFLGRKTVAEQNEMLGVGRADLWRKGTITLSDLLNFNGNPLTLRQLRDKYLP
jgi:hypothetical protein